MKERIHYFDIAKGILILLLLIHHFGSVTTRANINNPYFFLVVKWQPIFTTFFMQSFFIVSGYCSNFDSKTIPFLKKIVKQLVIPWVGFELMLAIFWAIYYSNINVTWFCEYLFSPPYTHLWFLNALAFSKITLFFLRKALSDKQLLILLALLSLFAIVINQLNIGHNLLTIRNSLGSCFFVALGYYLRKNDDDFIILLKYSPFIFIPLICYLMLSKCDIPVFTAVIHVSIEQFPLFLTLSTSGTFSFLQLCKLLNKNKFLEYFGKNSLIIYCVHFLPLYSLIVYFYALIKPTTLLYFILFLFVVYIIEITICLFLIQLLNTRPFKWLIGK